MQLEVLRDDFSQTRLVDPGALSAEDGEALLEVDSFSLTSNNVTYAVLGDMLGYWSLFPASQEGWGRIPVIGFADVVESRHPALAAGTRVFGFLPIADRLVVQPSEVNAHGFSDANPHRHERSAPVYSNYEILGERDREHEPQRSILRGLYVTAFMIDDFIDDNDRFGADTAIISSASSKTALMTAHRMKARAGMSIVGLTGGDNVEFVRSLGVYDQVLAYGDASDAPGDMAVFIDVAGNVEARDAIHARFGDRLTHSMIIGMSNRPEPGIGFPPPPPAGPEPRMLFAPTQIAKRSGDWGAAELNERLDAAWLELVEFSREWMEIERGVGFDAVEDVWQRLISGDVDPSKGHYLSLREAAGHPSG